MRFKFIGFSLGVILCAVSLLMFIPAWMDFAVGNIRNSHAFFYTGLGGLFLGSLFAIINYSKTAEITVRESFVLTTSCWFAASLLASVPFMLSDLELSFTNAFFEAASGITTTGSTVLSGLDEMSRGILTWRSLTQWIGGIGVIALGLVFLPFMRVGGMQLFRTESSDRSEKALPRTVHVVGGIFTIYLALTVFCGLSYYVLGMNGFDAFNHALTTMPTGGFSTHDASMGYFDSAAIYWTCIVFMTLGGLPFILYLKMIVRGDTELFFNSQVRAFLTIVALAVLVMTVWLTQSAGMDAFTALTYNTFSVISVITTTGYAVVDYTTWGVFAVMFFLFLTYLGGCSGSTSGGLKTMRLQIAARQGIIQLKRLIYPHGVFTLTYEGKMVTQPVLQSVMVFLSLYVVSNVFLALILSFTGADFMTALSGAATAIANVGPGVGDVIGPAGNFSTLPGSSKFILSIAMIMGRLELMTIFVFFHPAFWKH